MQVVAIVNVLNWLLMIVCSSDEMRARNFVIKRRWLYHRDVSSQIQWNGKTLENLHAFALIRCWLLGKMTATKIFFTLSTLIWENSGPFVSVTQTYLSLLLNIGYFACLIVCLQLYWLYRFFHVFTKIPSLLLVAYSSIIFKPDGIWYL